MRFLVVFLIVFVCSAATVSAQTKPEFKLGFKALAEQVPSIVGEPIEDEKWGANGDSLQQTTTGLMVWRRSDNQTLFTNGATTWVNGPVGVQSRANNERFDWESVASVTFDGVAVTVNSMQRLDRVGRATTPRAGNTFLQLDVTVENVDQQAVEHHTVWFKLKTNEGYEYGSSFGGGVVAGTFEDGQLKKGESVRGKLTFEIPASATGSILSYQYLALRTRTPMKIPLE